MDDKNNQEEISDPMALIKIANSSGLFYEQEILREFCIRTQE